MGSFLKNPRGFSLVELLVGLGISAILMVVSVGVYSMILNVKENSEALLQQTIASHEVSLAISSIASCNANFRGKSARLGEGPKPLTLYRTVSATGATSSPFTAASQDYLPLKIKDLTLEFIGHIGPNYLAQIKLYTEAPRTGFEFKPLVYNFKLYVDETTQTVIGCSPPQVALPLAKLGTCGANQMISGLKADGTLNCIAMPPGPPGPPGPSGGNGNTCMGTTAAAGSAVVCTSSGWLPP